jgi:hypothetical protein
MLMSLHRALSIFLVTVAILVIGTGVSLVLLTDCSRSLIKEWVFLRKMFSILLNPSAGFGLQEKTFPASGWVCPSLSVSFVRTTAVSKSKVRSGREQPSAYICLSPNAGNWECV